MPLMEITGQNRYKTEESPIKSPITGSPLPHVFYGAAIIKPQAEVVRLKGEFSGIEFRC